MVRLFYDMTSLAMINQRVRLSHVQIVVGNFGLSPGQSRAQMALWSIMAAPLILSVDLATISDWAREIILNRNLIAINQDPLGAMGRRILQVIRSIFSFYTRFVLLE
jgi:hypothetical protein